MHASIVDFHGGNSQQKKSTLKLSLFLSMDWTMASAENKFHYPLIMGTRWTMVSPKKTVARGNGFWQPIPPHLVSYRKKQDHYELSR